MIKPLPGPLHRACVLYWSLALLAGCNSQASIEPGLEHVHTFGPHRSLGLVEHDAIDEASGLAASRRNPGVLWAHNDSGDQSRLFALDTLGRHLGIYMLDGVAARDWEDMAIGPGPEAGVDYLYIGDIGDNNARYPYITVHRVREPAVHIGQAPIDTILTNVESYTLQYADGPRDAEALVMDPLANALYVVSKEHPDAGVYRVPLGERADTLIMQRVSSFDLPPYEGENPRGHIPTAADISPDGLELLIKTYNNIYYWQRSSGEATFFARPPQVLDYDPEPQGEAIAWAGDGTGFYTISEEPLEIPAYVLFYARMPRETTQEGP